MTENLSTLTNFKINFADRQDLKIVEDAVIDLGVILPTSLSTIIRIKDQCQVSADRMKMSQEESFDFDSMMEEFEEYIREARQLVDRSKSLKESVSSTTQLVCSKSIYEC